MAVSYVNFRTLTHRSCAYVSLHFPRCDTCSSFNDNSLLLCGSCSAPRDAAAAAKAEAESAAVATSGLSSGAGSLMSLGAAASSGGSAPSLLGSLSGSLLSSQPGSLLGGAASSGSLLGASGGSLLVASGSSLLGGTGSTQGGSLLNAPAGLLSKGPVAPTSGSLLTSGAGAAAAKPKTKAPKASLSGGDDFPIIKSDVCKAGRSTPAQHDLTASVSAAPAAAAGAVWTWGLGDCEQLGHGEEEIDVPKPMRLQAVDKFGVRFVRIVSGGLHNLGLTADGQVWSWGCNDDGPLGRADTASTEVRQVTEGGIEKERITAIAAGDCHSLALDARGRVWFWGAYKGREGHMQHDGEGGEKVNAVPSCLPDFSRRYGKVVRIASGLNHSIAITTRGIALAWGMGEAGQLGKQVVTAFLRGQRHNRALLVPNPVYAWVDGVKQIKSTAVKWARAWGAGFSTYLEDTEGRVWVCGLNNYGQLGVGDQENRMQPTLLPTPRGAGEKPLHGRLAAVAGGQHCALMLAADGALYSMGRGDSGQLGLSANKDDKPKFAAASFLPQRIPQQRFGGSAVVQVAGAGAFSLALTADGKVWSWGYGDMGQLGNGADEDEVLPFNVTAACGGLVGVQSLQVAAGDQHSVLLGVPADAAPTQGAAKRARKQ